MDSLSWTFSDDPSDDDVAELRGRLAAWNMSTAKYFLRKTTQ